MLWYIYFRESCSEPSPPCPPPPPPCCCSCCRRARLICSRSSSDMLLLCRGFVLFTRYSVMESRSAAQVLVEEKCVYAGKFGGLCCKGTDHLRRPLYRHEGKAQQMNPTTLQKSTACLRKPRNLSAQLPKSFQMNKSLKTVSTSIFATSLCCWVALI